MQSLFDKDFYNKSISKESITQSQKDLINKTYEIRHERKYTRNVVNPITGDIAMPSISVKGAKELNPRSYF